MKKLLTLFFIFCFASLSHAYTVGSPPAATTPSYEGYAPDPSAADHGVTDTTAVTIKNLVDSIGSSLKATMILSHNGASNETTFTLTTSETISGNIAVYFEEGAFIDGVGTLILDSPAQIIANPKQHIFGSSITITFTNSGKVSPDWWTENTTPGTTDMYSALSSAETSLSSGGKIKANGETYAMATSLTINSDVYIDLSIEGSKIKPGAAKTLTVYSPEHIIASQRRHIIDITKNSTDPLAFTKDGVVYPEWWGAVADNITDCAPAINLALDTENTCQLGSGYYKINSVLIIKDGVSLLGSGNSLDGTVLITSSAIDMINSYGVGVSVGEAAIVLKNFRMLGNDTATCGIEIGGAGSATDSCIIENVNIQGCLIGMDLEDFTYGYVRDMLISGGAGGTFTDGIKLKDGGQNIFTNLRINGFVKNFTIDGDNHNTLNKVRFWSEATHIQTTSLLYILNGKHNVCNDCTFENNTTGITINEILIESDSANNSSRGNVFNDCYTISENTFSSFAPLKWCKLR